MCALYPEPAIDQLVVKLLRHVIGASLGRLGTLEAQQPTSREREQPPDQHAAEPTDKDPRRKQ
jgi:hypothetical protein